MKGLKISAVILLLAVACGLSYLCVRSVMTPIHFQNEKDLREAQVVDHLKDIRTAEIEFKAVNGRYTADLDSLIDFVLNNQKRELKKEGALNEDQLKAGLTEAKVAEILKRKNPTEIAANGLQGFVRDSVFTPMLQALYKDKYTAESFKQIKYIPFSVDKKVFETELGESAPQKNGNTLPLIEVRAPYDSYLGDLNHQELVNLKDEASTLSRYEGVKFGDVYEPNNNAGNWE